MRPRRSTLAKHQDPALQNWGNNAALNATFQARPSAGFIVNGAPLPPNSALASLGAELLIDTRWAALAKFDGEFARGSQTHAGKGTLRSANVKSKAPNSGRSSGL